GMPANAILFRPVRASLKVVLPLGINGVLANGVVMKMSAVVTGPFALTLNKDVKEAILAPDTRISLAPPAPSKSAASAGPGGPFSVRGKKLSRFAGGIVVDNTWNAASNVPPVK